MCGIFGIANHSDASQMTYLGLYALQHRGQESTGISSSDGYQVHTHKAMCYVADVFSEDVIVKLKGVNAIGHTRYSTAGDSSEGNAQPIVVKCTYGTVALVHNGNLINAVSLRESLEHQGSIFQSTSDSEVILHLLARSEGDSLLDALGETLRDRKSTRLNSSHQIISYAVFCLKKKKNIHKDMHEPERAYPTNYLDN